jgi:Na+/proline symporter
MKPLFGEMSDKRFLLVLRIVLVLFTAGVLIFALNNTSTMYEMVQNAYKVTLVGALVPLVCGIYWKRASTQGALLSSALGLAVWGICEKFFAEATVPPQLVGLAAAAIGMVVGSYAPQLVRDARQAPSAPF